jgi:hypothetical protein
MLKAESMFLVLFTSIPHGKSDTRVKDIKCALLPLISRESEVMEASRLLTTQYQLISAGRPETLFYLKIFRHNYSDPPPFEAGEETCELNTTQNCE